MRKQKPLICSPYAPVTRAISEEDLVAPEEDVERGPTLEDKRRMLD